MASNNVEQTTTTSEVYSRWVEYSEEDVKTVCRLEDEEQQRRIMDTFGEQLKRSAAAQVSEIFSTTLRPGWFQKGSAYVFHLLRVARSTGSEILSSSQLRALSAKIQIASDRGLNKVHDLKQSFDVAGETATIAVLNAKFKVQETLDETIEKAQETSRDVKVKMLTASENVKSTSQDVSHDVVAKLQGTSHDVKLKLQETFAAAQEKIQAGTQKLRNASLELLGKVLTAIMQLIESVRAANSRITYSVLEEDSERIRRMNSETEATAIANAFAVSSLIKELGPEFYRPAEEPRSTYTTQMLEDIERKRRESQDSTDNTAVKNARAVSTLVKNYTTPVEVIPPAKVEFVEEIKVHKPMGATM